MVDTVDTLEARGLPMPNLRPKLNLRDLVMLNPRLNPRLTLMLNMDTMDIPPPMDTMSDIIPVLTDMDTTGTDILERDLLMLNHNITIIDTTTVDSTIMDTTIGDTMVDSLDITIIEMSKQYLI